MSGGRPTGIVGATGRLGSALDRALTAAGGTVSLRADRSGWRMDGPPAVVVDASAAGCFGRTVDLCCDTGAALVYAVSDLPPAHLARLGELAGRVPVVRATNLSLGHWLQTELLETVARTSTALPRMPDASVWERHPITKADRPSASARALAEVWRAATGTAVSDVASRRGGHPVSSHSVQVDLPQESITITHAVAGIEAAVRGALLVLGWIGSAPAGLVTTRQVFDDLLLTRTAPS